MFRVVRSPQSVPKSVVAFKSLVMCRVDGAQGLRSVPVEEFLRPGVPENNFSKRCVELRKRQRAVAYALGEIPKSVLSGTFKKSRRAAWTEMSLRMSERLARTFEVRRIGEVKRTGFLSRVVRPQFSQLRESSMASAQSTWRPLSDVASQVLRKVRVSGPAESPLQPVRVPSPVQYPR
jgi:hypothetical protein